MTRPGFYGTKKRTREQMRTAMEMRLTLAASIDTITVDEMMRNGFTKADAEARLELARRRRAG